MQEKLALHESEAGLGGVSNGLKKRWDDNEYKLLKVKYFIYLVSIRLASYSWCHSERFYIAFFPKWLFLYFSRC